MPRRVSRRGLTDSLHCTTAGSMPRAWNSSTSNVRANQPRSSSPTRSSSITQAPGSGIWMKRITPSAARQQRQLGRARGEAPAPLADEAELLDDLVLEVPGHDQDHIGFVF